MRLAILLTICILFAVPCMAQDTTTLGWDPSTSEPLDLGEGGGYVCYARNNQGQPYDLLNDIVCAVAEGPNQCTFDTSAYRGRYWFVCDAWLTEQGETFRSDFSNEVTVGFKPNPPGNLQKIVQTATYPIRKVGGFLAGLFGTKDNLRVTDTAWNES